jgi:hypothetical protein
LNQPQKRAILCGFLDLERRMEVLETLLGSNADTSPFLLLRNDLSPAEPTVASDCFARVRAAMLSLLAACEVPLEVRPKSRRWELQCGLGFLRTAVDRLGPRKLRGYGPVDDDALALSVKIREDLGQLIDEASACLRAGARGESREPSAAGCTKIVEQAEASD